MVTSLIELAKENDIKYAVDIYPMYGSDVGAALRGGNDIRGALIGPGVHASHGNGKNALWRVRKYNKVTCSIFNELNNIKV